MTTVWINFVGAYLLIGSLISGLGLLARLRWHGYEGTFLPNRKSKIAFGIGTAIGILFWPIILFLIPILRKVVRRHVNKVMGYCEHADAFRPFCEACSREQREKKTKLPTRYITADQIRKGNVDARARLEELKRRLNEFSSEEHKDKIEKLRNELLQIENMLPGTPVVPSCYLCGRCKKEYPGFPLHVTKDRHALCETCRREAPDA